jgi:hypothetical protein
MAEIQRVSLFHSTFSTELQNLTEAQKAAIVKEFWPIGGSPGCSSYDSRVCAAFFDYLQCEVKQIRHHRERFAVETVGAIIDLIRTVRNSSTKPLADLIQDLSTTFLNVDEAPLQRSLELAVRLWLTINTNSPLLEVSATVPLEMPMAWNKTASLKDLITGRWEKKTTVQRSKTVLQIDDCFTAAYLVSVCGMTLRWTEYLSDHLTADCQRQVLTVYKHKAYLSNRLKSQELNPIPIEVIEEALDSLNLLFPYGDPATKQLLARQGQLASYRLGSCKRPRELNIQRYEYWREELETLVDSFNRPPRTWKQLATDRRNLNEWAIFWVTVMVAVLTLVSIPCNIIQATYSVKAYHATLAQGNGLPHPQ